MFTYKRVCHYNIQVPLKISHSEDEESPLEPNMSSSVKGACKIVASNTWPILGIMWCMWCSYQFIKMLFCFVKLNLLLYVYFKKVVEQRNIAQFVMHILFFIQSLPTICWCMVTVVVANQICDKEGPWDALGLVSIPLACLCIQPKSVGVID